MPTYILERNNIYFDIIKLRHSTMTFEIIRWYILGPWVQIQLAIKRKFSIHFIFIKCWVRFKAYISQLMCFLLLIEMDWWCYQFIKNFQKMMVKTMMSSFDRYNLVLFIMNSGTSYTRVLIWTMKMALQLLKNLIKMLKTPTICCFGLTNMVWGFGYPT